MDILNFISWIKGGRVVTSVDPTQTLLPVGLKDSRRDDGYLAGAITVSDFAAQLVSAPAYKVYTALLTQSGTSAPVATVLSNPSALVITFTRSSAGSYTVDSTSFVRGKVIINNMNPYIESSWPIGSTSVDFPKVAVSGGPPSATCEIKIPSGMFTTGTSVSFSSRENGVLADDVLSKYLGFIEIRVYP